MGRIATTRPAGRPRGRECLDGLSDGALMSRTAARDQQAFGALYARHIASARAVSYRTIGDRQQAEDVCQEAFLAVWRVAGGYDPRFESARPWVMRIVRNRAIDHLRVIARNRGREIADDAVVEGHAAPPEQGTEARALGRIEARAMRDAIAGLPPAQRRVIDLAFIDERTHSEIADALGLPMGTVKARARRGLERMRASPDLHPARPAATGGSREAVDR